MNRFWNRAVLAAAAAAFFFFSAPLWAAAAGAFVLLRGGGIVRNVVRRSVARRNGFVADNATLDAAIKAHREKTRTKLYNRADRCWRIENFPLDMRPENPYHWHTRVEIPGVGGVVEAAYINGRPSFSMVVADAHVAEDVSRYIKENCIIGADVIRRSDGKFSITTDNAGDMSALVKEFYPSKEMVVRREVRTTQQYLVRGCGSYDEALEKFHGDRFSYSADNVYVSYQDTVNGVPQHGMVSGQMMDTEELELGTYVINETTSEVFSKKVNVFAPQDCTEEAMRSLAVDAVGQPGKPGYSPFVRSDDLVEDQCVVNPVLSDGIATGEAKRYMKVDGTNIYMPGDTEPVGAPVLTVRFDKSEDLLDVASGRIPLSYYGDRIAIESRNVLEEGRRSNKDFVLEIPVDGELLSCVQIAPGLVKSLMDRYGDSALSEEEAKVAVLQHYLLDGKELKVSLDDVPDLTEAKVNGLEMSLFRQRMEDLTDEGLAPALDDGKKLEWINDAVCVKDVNMRFDDKKMEITLTTSYHTNSGTLKVERMTEKLDEDTALKFMSRDVSRAELLDVAFRNNPDFKVYLDPVYKTKTVYANGMKPFVMGELPLTKSEERKARRQLRQASVVTEKVAKNQGVKMQ